MKNRPIYSTHIGAASILLIFMVLSLISFAALSLVNSRADYILSQKLYDRSVSYYGACHEANAFIASSLDSLTSDSTASESINLSDTQTLEIEITSGSDSDPCTILRWQVVTDDSLLELDETLPVFK